MNKNIIKLQSEVKFYIPSTISKSTPIDNDTLQERINFIAGRMSDLFGGATSYTAVGYYKADDGKLITERITIVTSYTDKLSFDFIETMLELASVNGYDWGQESMLIEINGTGYLVPTSKQV